MCVRACLNVCVYVCVCTLFICVCMWEHVYTCVFVYVLCVGVCLWGGRFCIFNSKVQRKQRINHKTEFLYYDTMSLQVYIPTNIQRGEVIFIL